jgi:hypothetical protein
MRGKVTVTGMSGLVANFKALDERVQRYVLEAQQQNGEEHRQRMSDQAPRDTGFTAEHTEVRFSEGGYTYNVGYWAETYLAAGLEFYVPYPLFGTVNQPANDWVFRATEPMRDISRRRVGDAVKRGVEESAQANNQGT